MKKKYIQIHFDIVFCFICRSRGQTAIVGKKTLHLFHAESLSDKSNLLDETFRHCMENHSQICWTNNTNFWRKSKHILDTFSTAYTQKVTFFLNIWNQNTFAFRLKAFWGISFFVSASCVQLLTRSIFERSYFYAACFLWFRILAVSNHQTCLDAKTTTN